jgi:NADH dehydrogenase
LREELGLYAERKLRERGVDIVNGGRVVSYDGPIVTLADGTSIAASTLIWTAGVKPCAVIASLPCEKERGRLRVSEYLAVPGVSGLWAAGDCAAVPDVTTGTLCPPTTQHGLRQGVAPAKNIEAAIAVRALQPFRYRAMGLLASIGRQTGVAMRSSR